MLNGSIMYLSNPISLLRVYLAVWGSFVVNFCNQLLMKTKFTCWLCFLLVVFPVWGNLVSMIWDELYTHFSFWPYLDVICDLTNLMNDNMESTDLLNSWVKTWKKYIELTISFACKIQQGRWLRFQTQVHIPLQCQSRQQIHCNFHFFLRNFCLCRWYILSLKLSARNYNDNQWVQASSIWYSFLLL